MRLKPIKTTFRINATSNNKLKDLQEYINSNHCKNVTKTELINISLNEFLGKLEAPTDIDKYLIKYNLL